jgi:hypothetical protein
MSEPFDYGKKLPDGQHERHPVNTEGEYVAPIRRTYLHKCGASTKVGTAIAETYGKNPQMYGRTFCCGCRDYFPLWEFKWEIDGVTVGELGGEPGKRLEG